MLLSESASAQLSLVSTTGSGGNPVYHYDIKVTDTGTTNIGTFWFAWVPDEDFLASVPSATANPPGWSNTLTGSGNSTDGTAIEWVASSNPITPGASLGGFGFTTTDSPSALAGKSASHPSAPVLTSFVYVGAAFSDPGFSFQVSPAATSAASTTTLAASAPSARAGTSVTFTATVAPSSGSGPVPTGSVRFTQNGNLLGSGTLGANGTASLNTSLLPVGADPVIASYGGDTNYSASTSAPLTETISAASSGVATSTALTSPQSSAAVGAAFSFTASITASGSGPAPTGTVNFTENGNLLGSAAVQSDGIATFSTSALPTGSDSIVAAYSGDSVYAASASAPLTETISQPPTLVPSIAGSSLPKAVVAGTSVRGVVKLKVTNGTGSQIKGRSTLAIYATTTGAIDSSAVLVGQVVRSLTSRPGRPLVTSVPIHLAAGALPAGTYTLVARVTDPSGHVNDSAAGQTLDAAPAFLALTPALVKSKLPASASSGAKLRATVVLTITNQGNISTSGATSISLFATANGVVDHAAISISTGSTRARIRPGRAIHATIRVSLLPAIAPGSYVIVARLTDSSGGISSTIIGPMTIS